MKVFDHGRRGETGVGAAQHLGNARMLAGHSLDMGFIKHRIGQGNRRRLIAAPVEFFIDDTGLEAMRWIIRLPRKATDDLARVGIDQQSP